MSYVPVINEVERFTICAGLDRVFCGSEVSRIPR
jgi:hypothetical protein